MTAYTEKGQSDGKARTKTEDRLGQGENCGELTKQGRPHFWAATILHYRGCPIRFKPEENDSYVKIYEANGYDLRKIEKMIDQRIA